MLPSMRRTSELDEIEELRAKPADIYIQLIDAVLHGDSAAFALAEASSSAAHAANSAAGHAGAEGDQPVAGPSGTCGKSMADRWLMLSEVLSRKCGRIDHSKVLSLIDESQPLWCVMPLLQGLMCNQVEQRRQLCVLKSLRRAENLSCKEQQVGCRQRGVVVSSDRACCLCHRRMGTSALVVYPNSMLAHYACFRRQTPILEGSSPPGGLGGLDILPLASKGGAAAFSSRPVAYGVADLSL